TSARGPRSGARLRQRGGAGSGGCRCCAARDVGPEAWRCRLRDRAGRGAFRIRGSAYGGRRHDGRGRRVCGRLPGRRRRARARDGRALRLTTRSDAVIEISAEVGAELKGGRPVVALETTLVAHGFPAGEGLGVALEAERRVREAGAVPASVGVVGGAVRVGLSAEELGRFAEAGESARKGGARGLPGVVAHGGL